MAVHSIWSFIPRIPTDPDRQRRLTGQLHDGLWMHQLVPSRWFGGDSSRAKQKTRSTAAPITASPLALLPACSSRARVPKGDFQLSPAALLIVGYFKYSFATLRAHEPSLERGRRGSW